MKTKSDIGGSGRFTGRTDVIPIRKLERETERVLLLGFLVAVTVHALAAVFFTVHTPAPFIPRPIPVELIVRPPRLKKPFVIGRRGARKRQLLPRMPAQPRLFDDLVAKPPAPPEPPLLEEWLTRIPGPAAPGFDTAPGVGRPIPYAPPKRYPYGSPSDGEILSIDDLDYGRYKSVVFRDPFNRRNVTGFVYLPAAVWGAELTPLRRPVIGLAEALRKYTGIKPRLDRRILLSSQELDKYPFLYISTDEGFELNKVEKERFAAYLERGGFAVLDNGFPQDKYHNAEAALRQMLFDAKTAIGSRAYVSIILPGHPLFHTFFDFPYGPPQGATLMPAARFNTHKKVVDREYHPTLFLEGLWIRGRLAAIYSDMGYGLRWAMIGENAPQQKFGVNLVVYALTGGAWYLP